MNQGYFYDYNQCKRLTNKKEKNIEKYQKKMLTIVKCFGNIYER